MCSLGLVETEIGTALFTIDVEKTLTLNIFNGFHKKQFFILLCNIADASFCVYRLNFDPGTMPRSGVSYPAFFSFILVVAYLSVLNIESACAFTVDTYLTPC